MDAPAPHVERHPLEALQRGDALIDHPVAARVSWRPLHVGGSNFRTAALASEGEGTWRVGPSLVRGRLWRRARPFSPEREVRTVDIVALQLLPERVVMQRSRYWSYELNLVLADGSRVGLMDHGALDALRGDARRLGALLGVPVWEAEGRPMGLLERLFGGGDAEP